MCVYNVLFECINFFTFSKSLFKAAILHVTPVATFFFSLLMLI